MYKAVSDSDATWSFNSADNASITETGDGFNASKTFYSNNDAGNEVNISYKGLTKIFNFILKSATAAPDNKIIAHRIDLNNWQ